LILPVDIGDTDAVSDSSFLCNVPKKACRFVDVLVDIPDGFIGAKII
jgi:hypothetical protein